MIRFVVHCPQCYQQAVVGPDMTGERRSGRLSVAWDCDGCRTVAVVPLAAACWGILVDLGVEIVDVFPEEELRVIAAFRLELASLG